MKNALLDSLANATNLPTEVVSEFLIDLVLAKGKDPTTVTLDDVREILSELAQEVLLETKKQLEL